MMLRMATIMVISVSDLQIADRLAFPDFCPGKVAIQLSLLPFAAEVVTKYMSLSLVF
jgi:hypothetical protein